MDILLCYVNGNVLCDLARVGAVRRSGPHTLRTCDDAPAKDEVSAGKDEAGKEGSIT